MDNNKIERIKTLVQELNKASNAYYNTDKVIITDREFDVLFDELKALETETNYILSSSPTQKVGYVVSDKLQKVTHTTKMLSLDKTKDVNELKKFLGDNEGVLSWKEDGLTIVLSYDNGILVDAVTRGNGEVGSRILLNAKVFKAGIPLKINYKGHLVVRGEGLISKEDFNVININDEYANPRNLTSGSIMALDNKIAKNRCLQFKAFSIAECDKKFELYSEQLDWLKEMGFNPVEYYKVDKINIEDTIENFFKNKIDKYEFMTDGLVLRINNIQYGNSLGETSHHYLHSIALKWKDSTVETTLRNIQFQVGRTGVLTPVANFDEVEIEQSMVSKASLHNISILKALELGIGDTISVYKANMIIPQIDDNLTRSNNFVLPTECPECHGKVEIQKTNDAEFLVCTNPNCSAKLVQKISHAVKRDCLNVDGLSEATIEKFIDKGFIKNIADIYKLSEHRQEIIHMEGMGLKSYNNLISSIETSKYCKLSNFLFALGIPNVGKSTAKDLAKQFKNINNLIYCNKVQLLNMDDIGVITADSIYDWINDENNIKLLNELLKYIIIEEDKPKAIQSDIKENPLLGKHIYPTGKFSMKKDELKAKLESIGAIVENGYKKSLDYLICGGDTSKSGKVQRAIDDNVPLMSEKDMMKILN